MIDRTGYMRELRPEDVELAPLPWPPSLSTLHIHRDTPWAHAPTLLPRERRWAGDTIHVGDEIAEQIRRARG